MATRIIAFTKPGADLAAKLCRVLSESGIEAFAPERHCTGPVRPLTESLTEWTGRRFLRGDTLIFVGAAGIALRAVAPYITAKDRDPAVICIDEGGRFVIPLLSGHLGGANRRAEEIAAILGALAVVTTASDGRQVFSPDAWAAKSGCAVADPAVIKPVAAALLAGEPVGFRSDFPVEGALPKGLDEGADAPCGVEIALQTQAPFPKTLQLIPRCIVAGIGCRKGVDADTIERRLRALLAAQGLPIEAVGFVASLDRKADEVGLRELCERLGVELRTFTAEELMAVEGKFTASERVLRHTGADNVCERAALAACDPQTGDGRLIARKCSGEGVTVALARRVWRGKFTEGGGAL